MIAENDNAHVGSLLNCVATFSQGNYVLIRSGLNRGEPRKRVWRVTIRAYGAAKTTTGTILADALERALRELKSMGRETR